MTEFFDNNSDGVADVVTVDSNADGYDDVTAFDVDQNGMYELVLLDTDGDSDFEAAAVDQDQNGRFEGAAVDQNNDGLLELLVTDTDGDGWLDAVSNSQSAASAGSSGGVDLDTAIWGPDGPSVGGTWSNTESKLAELIYGQTGQVGTGSGDSDNDGVLDPYDIDPYDRNRWSQ